jgi:hypothetical protein
LLKTQFLFPIDGEMKALEVFLPRIEEITDFQLTLIDEPGRFEWSRSLAR